MVATASHFLTAPRFRGGRKAAQLAGRWVGFPLLTLFIASVVLFVAVAMQPGDPVTQILGSRATKAAYRVEQHKLGLDRPLIVQYWHWIHGAVHGSFGDSLVYKQSVSSLIWPRLTVTLGLVAYAGVLIVLFGVGLGVAGGVRRRFGPVVAVLSGIGVAVPGFLAAQVLIAVFAVRLGWFPVLGSGSGIADRINHLTLPSVALAIASVAYVAQISRTAVADAAGRPHAETARGRGLPGHLVTRRHVLRNASIPIATVSGLAVASLFAGAVVVEQAFGLGGVGSLLVQSVADKDSNTVLAVGLILVAVFIVTTTLLDLLRYLLDPRMRKGARR